MSEEVGRRVYIDIMKLPVKNAHADCGNCGAASSCCKKGATAAFSEAEATQLIGAGTELRHVDRSELPKHKPGRGREFYQFMGDCANLGPNGECTIYESRPKVCRDFPEGGLECQILHIITGNPLPPQWEV